MLTQVVFRQQAGLGRSSSGVCYKTKEGRPPPSLPTDLEKNLRAMIVHPPTIRSEGSIVAFLFFCNRPEESFYFPIFCEIGGTTLDG